jgi:hypothetical protein
MSVVLDVYGWAKEQFGNCQLGDERRTARVVNMAAQFAANPSGSTPEQTETWKDCKAAYRLIDNDDVTFAALGSPHWRQTMDQHSGHYLVIGDTTTISFDAERQVSGMGITTNDDNKGFLLHSALVVNAETSDIIGLGGQAIHYRQKVPKGESFRERLQRDRESKIWGDVIRIVGKPNLGVRLTHVFDRGADNFEVFCHLLLQQSDWVIRAAQLTRLVSNGAGEKVTLTDYLATLPISGTYELTITANGDQTARKARVEVRHGPIGLSAPRDCGKYVRECGITFLTMHVVEVREINPPPGVQPLHWVLYTSHSVVDFDDAWRVIGYYEQRPLVEEFHKALKTGCRLEERQYETAARWERITAILSIVAVRLLQMKTIAKTTPNRPAEECVPKRWIEILTGVRGGSAKPIRTIRDFVRALGGLGGHLGRKHDGEPGWMTLWRGFNKLHLLIRGANAERKRCG